MPPITWQIFLVRGSKARGTKLFFIMGLHASLCPVFFFLSSCRLILFCSNLISVCQSLHQSFLVCQFIQRQMLIKSIVFESLIQQSTVLQVDFNATSKPRCFPIIGMPLFQQICNCLCIHSTSGIPQDSLVFLIVILPFAKADQTDNAQHDGRQF